MRCAGHDWLLHRQSSTFSTMAQFATHPPHSKSRRGIGRVHGAPHISWPPPTDQCATCTPQGSFHLATEASQPKHSRLHTKPESGDTLAMRKGAEACSRYTSAKTAQNNHAIVLQLSLPLPSSGIFASPIGIGCRGPSDVANSFSQFFIVSSIR